MSTVNVAGNYHAFEHERQRLIRFEFAAPGKHLPEMPIQENSV